MTAARPPCDVNLEGGETMQDAVTKATRIGWTGLVFLFVSWTLFCLPRSLLPRGLDPWLDLLPVLLSGPAAVMGFAAGRVASRWWYLVAGAGLVTAVVLLVEAAV